MRGEQREREGTLARFTLLSVSRFAGGHSSKRDLRSMFRVFEAHRSASLLVSNFEMKFQIHVLSLAPQKIYSTDDTFRDSVISKLRIN